MKTLIILLIILLIVVLMARRWYRKEVKDFVDKEQNDVRNWKN